MKKRPLKIITCILLVLFTLWIGFDIFICFYGQNDNVTFEEDALIVLGAGLRGEVPSSVLAERLKAALRYYEQNPDVIIVVSGGQGANEAITEALAMERYLVGNGIPAEKIIKEEMSTNTRENIAFSKQILDDYFSEPYKTAIVTSDFHIFRSNMISVKAGLESAHTHGKILKHTIPANYLRETAAVLFQVFIFS